MTDYTSKDVARFWSKVKFPDFIGTDECWEWQASIASHGYGQFSLNKYPHTAHRLSWVFIHGDVPDDLYVLHKCDNRRCVNPQHLFLGTHKYNILDMVLKGRASR